MTQSSRYSSGSMGEAATKMSGQLAAIKKDLTDLDTKLGQLWKVWDADSRRDMQKTIGVWKAEQEELTRELDNMQGLMDRSGAAVRKTEAMNTDTAGGGGGTGGEGTPRYRLR
ncbi:WXG100 family type VII secretion target [Phytohabitans suffuscus]|uniref:Uncharacterized protein n=1 Tax=Phytohabitans suffuscus TaxID=624315 RepID=A0A6F8YQ99_9ACTN|nr:hypothetical protein [Phytohabitans suffuscus]BCB88317.1 hypothetical protein Psuf_056300 [Phytohabitans suffuscus]